MQQPPIFLPYPYVYYPPQPPGPPMPIPRPLYTFPQPPIMPSPTHQQQHHQRQPQPQPNPPLLPPFSRLEPKTAALIETNHALRLQRQHQERCKHELAQLHRERRAALDAFKNESTEKLNLTTALDLMERENARWGTPNANLAEMYKLQGDIARVEKAKEVAGRRWEELGERIEEKHVEIAFGASDGD